MDVQQNQTQNNAIQETQQLIQRLYQYDKTGQLTGIQDTRRGNINYKYDPVGRLLEANSKLGKETFNFDPASNIIDRYNTSKEQSHQQTLKGKSIPSVQKVLTDNNYTRKNPVNLKNQRWVYQDGSEVQIHAYGNQSKTQHIQLSVGKIMAYERGLIILTL